MTSFSIHLNSIADLKMFDWSAQAAITKYYRPCDLNNRKSFPSSGG